MNEDERRRLEERGWKIGSPEDFLGLTPEEAAAVAIAAVPEQAEDPECPYDPNDPAAVEQFWKRGSVRRRGQRRP